MRTCILYMRDRADIAIAAIAVILCVCICTNCQYVAQYVRHILHVTRFNAIYIVNKWLDLILLVTRAEYMTWPGASNVRKVFTRLYLHCNMYIYVRST